jgi:hypothetical protein
MRSHAFLAVPLLICFAAPCRASELDRLLGKLAEKGVLTAEEAAALAPAPPAPAPPAPRRVLDLTAEFRLRYQYEDNSANPFARSRGRYSIRLGGEAWNGGPVKLLFGLAGGSDAGGRSTNQSFGRNMEKKNIYLNYAYAEYSPAEWLRVRAGRMNSFLWDPTDMVWDCDLKPEGAAAALKARRGDTELFASAGFAALGESLQDPEDPYLLSLQQGISYGRGKSGADLKAALAFYAFGNVRGRPELPGRPSTAEGYLRSNSVQGGSYARGYDAMHASLEAGYSPHGKGAASVFGEYIKNTTLSRDAAGWIAGLRAGWRRPEAAGQWQLTGSLRRLEAEAWLDTYPDSDFYGGATGVEGAEVSLSVSLGGGVTFGTDYYSARRISGTGAESLLQTDISVKM